MSCPNCNHEMDQMKFCPHCGIDPVLFVKTVNVSYQLYNKGLQELQNQNLSSAQDNLSKSLEFNKNNYVARNLLGLIYYETGRIGDALRHWIISASMMRAEENPASRYIDVLQQNSRLLEKHGDAIKMYNQALNYVALKSDDMAIIQLKKAVEISPKFVDALNLLAFCCLIQKDKEKAISVIERVLAIDADNQIALNYYNEIFPSGTSRGKAEPQQIKKAVQPIMTQPSYNSLAPKSKKSFGNTFHLAEIVSFVIGALCMAAVLYILVIPSIIETKDGLMETELTAKTNLEQTYTTQLNAKDSALKEVEAERDRWQDSYNTANEQLAIAEKTSHIYKAANLRTTNQEEAATLLLSTEPSGLPNDIAELYTSLKAEIFPKEAQRLYNLGIQRYNARDYGESRSALEKCRQYADPAVSYMGNIYYYLGLIAEANSDIRTAKEHYSRVIEDYPNSANASRARTQLNALG